MSRPAVSQRHLLQILTFGCLIVSCLGCGVITRGLLYTDTIQPLCVDARGTSLGTRSAAGSSKRVEIPTTQVDISAEWDSRAIGDIAREHGITTVYGCDSRRQSVLLGLWRKDEVIIYGE
jgi:hypothetical protein